jgi:hypothetical protein
MNWAYQELLKHRALHRIVADLAEREGLSLRQARRIAGAAHKAFSQDLEHIDRSDMTVKVIYALETVVDRALETENLNAAIGATRTLVEILNLHVTKPLDAPHHPHYTGRRYG